MARLSTISCDVELVSSNGAVETGGLGGTWTRVAGRLGIGQAWRHDAGAGNANSFVSLINQSAGTNPGITFNGASRTYALRDYIRVPTQLPTANATFLRYSGSGTARYAARINTDGTISFYEEIGGTVYATTTWAVAFGRWYRIELKVVLDATPNVTTAELRIDDSVLATQTGLAGSASVGNIQLGNLQAPGANFAMDHDDIAVNDDTAGAGQTGYPGDGKVVLLLPISDNARGANWVAGAGATTNLFDAVDNAPPAGVVAASATNTSQIKNLTSDTTGNYDANMTSYANAGIGSGDTITVVCPLWVIGGSAVTSISHAMLLVSNPVANGGVASTFSTTAAVGTYPNAAWKPQNGTKAQIVYNPSVTLATSPVMRVGKRTANASAAMCCWMGIFVEYVPGVRPKPVVVSQAVQATLR